MNVLLAELSALFSLITAIIFWLNKFRIKSFPLNMLFFVILMNGAMDSVTTLTAFLKIPNIDLINIYYVIQFAVLMIYLLSHFRNKIVMVIGIVLGTLIVLYSINDIYYKFHQFKIATQAISMQGLLLSIFTLFILLKITLNAKSLLTHDPEFWFLSAMLLYFTLSTVCFVTAEMPLYDSKFIRNFTWLINSISSILSNVLYLIGLRCIKKHKNLSLQFT